MRVNFIERSQIIDKESGEILSTTEETKYRYEGEDDFVKFYVRFKGSDGMWKLPYGFLNEIARETNYSNNEEPMTIVLNKAERQRIGERCGIGEEQVRRYIVKALSCGILFKTQHKNEYEINPYFMSKGRWGNIRDLRKRFCWDESKKKWERRET